MTEEHETFQHGKIVHNPSVSNTILHKVLNQDYICPNSSCYEELIFSIVDLKDFLFGASHDLFHIVLVYYHATFRTPGLGPQF